VAGSPADWVVCAAGAYTFRVRDSFGDGLCCGHGAGSLALYLDGSLLWTLDTGRFRSAENYAFLLINDGRIPPSPSPPPPPPSPPVRAPPE
jgi:hypothetical protein